MKKTPNSMANSLNRQHQGEAMNLPEGIYIVPLRNGSTRFRVRIRRKGMKSISQNFKSLTLAKKWKREKEVEVENGLHFSYSNADRVTFSDAVIRYRKEILPHKPNDRKNVERHLKRWESELGYLKLKRIQASDIVEVREKLANETIKNGNKRSNGTVNRYLASLSHLLSIATREWMRIKENPALKVKKRAESQGRVRFLNALEQKQLLDACKASQSQYLYTIVVVALSTGMRRGEVLNLQWKDLDLASGRCIIHKTKNGERRVTHITGRALDLLQENHFSQKKLSSYLFPAKNHSGSIDIRKAWDNALHKSGVRDFRFHDLRHTFASHLAMNGATLAELSEALGHKSLQMVKRYAHFAESYNSARTEKTTKKMFEESL